MPIILKIVLSLWIGMSCQGMAMPQVDEGEATEKVSKYTEASNISKPLNILNKANNGIAMLFFALAFTGITNDLQEDFKKWYYKEVQIAGSVKLQRFVINGVMTVPGWKLLRWLEVHPIQVRQSAPTPPPARRSSESVQAQLTRVISGEYVGGAVQAVAGAGMILAGIVVLVAQHVTPLKNLETTPAFRGLGVWKLGGPCLGTILLARGVGTIYQVWS
jgi:hypothetical protein